jgi:hypothetical protein
MLFETSIFSKRNWIKPELSNLPVSLDMDMNRLTSVGTEENKAIGTNLKNSWHK